jgi:hypothetical protein
LYSSRAVGVPQFRFVATESVAGVVGVGVADAVADETAGVDVVSAG